MEKCKEHSSHSGEMANVKAMRSGDKKRLPDSTRDVLRCVIVLTAIALCAGVLLGVVNIFTYVDSESVMLDEIASYYHISSDEVEKAPQRVLTSSKVNGYVVSAYEVQSANAAVYCSVGKEAYSGTIELLVFVENDIVTKVAVFQHSETQGIGTNVLNESYLSKYQGINLLEIESFVNDNSGESGDIEFLSGATKTSKGVFNAMNAVVYAHKNYGG